MIPKLLYTYTNFNNHQIRYALKTSQNKYLDFFYIVKLFIFFISFRVNSILYIYNILCPLFKKIFSKHAIFESRTHAPVHLHTNTHTHTQKQTRKIPP